MQAISMPEIVSCQEFEDLESLVRLIMMEREKRLNLTRELMLEKQKNKQLEEFIEKICGNGEKKQEERVCGGGEVVGVTVGAYPGYIRRLKIKNYKQKVKKYRERVKISRDFKGRSIAAKMKPRYNGKFAKKHIQI